MEDLTQTITIFRALIGAGHVDEASYLWSDFSDVLLVDLGAYTTVIELLGPLATRGTPRVSSDLAIAYDEIGMYDEAISQDRNDLADMLRAEDGDNSMRRLEQLAKQQSRPASPTGKPGATARRTATTGPCATPANSCRPWASPSRICRSATPPP